MSRTGTILDANTVRFERLLPGPLARAWDYLTRPELLATWFAEVTLEPRIGGAIAVRFTLAGDKSGGEDCNAAAVLGEVREYNPPHVLAFSWRPQKDGSTEHLDEGEVRFELAEHGDRVLLTLTHARAPSAQLSGYGGGWHAYLDNLDSRIAGGTGIDVRAAYQHLKPGYDAAVAQAVRQGAAE